MAKSVRRARPRAKSNAGYPIRRYILRTLDAAAPFGANTRLILSVVHEIAPRLSAADLVRELYGMERCGWLTFDPETQTARLTTAGRAVLDWRVEASKIVHLDRLFPGRFQGPPAHAMRAARIASLLAGAEERP
jgi:hypothetical protein